MARHRVLSRYYAKKAKGYREWLVYLDYYWDDETGRVTLETYETVELVEPYKGECHELGRRARTLKTSEVPEEVIAAVILFKRGIGRLGN